MKPRTDREALTVAMAVVPGIYSRNKHFAMYESADARRARARAGQIRGIVRHLSGAVGEVAAMHLARGEEHCTLTYVIPSVRLERRVVLSPLEAACLAYLAARAGVSGLGAQDGDRARVDAALRRLAVGLRLEGVEAGGTPAE